MSDRSEKKVFSNTKSCFRSESAMVVNQVEVLDINLPPLKTTGRAVSNTAGGNKKFETGGPSTQSSTHPHQWLGQVSKNPRKVEE